MNPYFITDRYEYDYCIHKGYNPLVDLRNFSIDICLRVEIQKEIFGHCVIGRGDVTAANERFYRWIWDNKPHQCEECMKPLNNYSAVYCSHILARGAYPEMAHDTRNINILCFEHHNQWENGDKKMMRIYPQNLKLIELLKSEYQKLKL